MIVKICGLTRPADAEAAVAAGADWIGINFWPRSKRYCEQAAAREVAAAARAAGPVRVVGVFVNAAAGEVTAIRDAVGLDLAQFHGDESPAWCAAYGGQWMKAIPLGGPADVAHIADYACDAVLVDTPTAGYGGSGRTGDWALARDAVATGKRIVLAGGLTPDNVGAAVRAVGPFGVDVAGGVEAAPGVKDPDAVARFVAAAKGGASAL